MRRQGAWAAALAIVVPTLLVAGPARAAAVDDPDWSTPVQKLKRLTPTGPSIPLEPGQLKPGMLVGRGGNLIPTNNRQGSAFTTHQGIVVSLEKARRFDPKFDSAGFQVGIVEFVEDREAGHAKGIVRLSNLWRFTMREPEQGLGKKIRLIRSRPGFSDEMIQGRALADIGKQYPFHGLSTNCEWWARGVVEGKRESRQAKMVTRVYGAPVTYPAKVAGRVARSAWSLVKKIAR